MCLFNYTDKVKEMLRSRKKKYTVYKVLKVKDGYFSGPYYDCEYKWGEIISSSKSSGPCLRYISINHGIHVFLNETSAIVEASSLRVWKNGYFILAKLVANIEDLIGANGYEEAVFRKVYFSKNEFFRHKKEWFK